MTGTTAMIIGATGGIGGNVARYSCENFDTTIMVGRSEARLSALQDSLAREGMASGTTEIAVGDIGDSKRMLDMVASTPSIDFLAVCSGITELGTLEIEREPLERMLTTNLLGVILSVQAVVDKMLSTPSGGFIVAMGSMSIRRQRPGHGGYAATQTGLHGYFRSLRRQLADSSVRTTLICPGFVRTKLAIEETPDIDESRMIPVSDIIETIDFLRHLSKHVDIPEIFLDCKAQLNYPN
jgi:NADP-dependent 3-hydroxy acid dehydrogenase YdfG